MLSHPSDLCNKFNHILQVAIVWLPWCKLRNADEYIDKINLSWWRHQMETCSALLAICAGNSPVPGEFPAQRPLTRSFDIFFDLRLNKRLSKQSWGWWFETLSCPLWRHCNVYKPQQSTTKRNLCGSALCTHSKRRTIARPWGWEFGACFVSYG